MFTVALFTIPRAWQQPECPSTDEWIKVWGIHRGPSVTKRSEPGSFAEIRMELELVIQSEVSQTEKNKYHILMHIRGNEKNGSDESICRTGTEMQIQRMNMWTQGGRGQWDKLGD